MPLRSRTYQTNFSAGQVDPRMLGREDIGIFSNAGAVLTNSSPLVQGGIRRRPGTVYLATLTGHTRLERFRFNDTQLYIFAFSNTELKIFNAAGTLLQTLTSQPWTASTMWQMRMTTSGDTTIITHEEFAMRKLLRTGASTFTITNFTFEADSSGYPRFVPYFKFADSTITLTPSATTGVGITLTTSDDYWTTDHVGSIVRYKGKEIDVTSRTNATVAVGTVRETLAGTSADSDWDENVFSAANGYARSVAFHSRRLWFGGSRDLPNFLWSSQSNAFFNFDVGTGLDDESIQGSLGTDDVNNIMHLHSGRHLQILSDAAVLYLRETTTQVVTPSTFEPRFTVPYGSADATPVRLDGATLFVQDTKKVVRELLFNDLQDSYTADPISLVSNDMITGAKQMTVFYGSTTGPEQWCNVVNDDGSIAIYHSVRSEKINSWYPWTTGTDSFESVTQLNGVVYASVKRSIPQEVGVTDAYYLEKFDFDTTVDSAKTLSSVSGNTWGGLTHLVSGGFGYTASVVDGNLFHGDYTVNSSGQVTTDEPATAPVGGLNYERTIKDMPPVIAGPHGSSMGVRKRIGSVVLRVFESVNFSVNGQEFLIRQVDDDLSVSPSPATNTYEFHLTGWTRDGQVTITQTAPLKFTLLSIWKEVLV